MAQINLTSDPSVANVVQIMPVNDPEVTGVYQVNINADPKTPGIVQANINFDPTTPGIVPVNFNSSASGGSLPEFALYRAILSGAQIKLITSLPTQLMNHARQSPTAPIIAFTTYNNYTGNPSYATEAGGSLNTEIRLINTQTQLVTFAVPPNPLYQSAWPSWLIDGSGFNFTTTKTTSAKQGIGQYKLATNSWSVIYDPGDFSFTSSNVNSNGDIVMAGTTPVSGGYVSYLYVLSGGVRTQLTTAPTLIAGIVAGDMGPSWSPDHTKIACVRIVSAGVFRIVIIMVGAGPTFTNGGETVVVPPGSASAFDGIPEFSPDGTYLITYYTDPANGAANGIYYMSAVDGSGRTQVPLLPNYSNTLCSFIPNGGSSHAFIYSAQHA